LTLFGPTHKILLIFIEKKKLKKLKFKIARKQLKSSQNILKISSSIGIDKINI